MSQIAYLVLVDEDESVMWVQAVSGGTGQSSEPESLHLASHSDQADIVRRGVASILQQQTGLEEI